MTAARPTSQAPALTPAQRALVQRSTVVERAVKNARRRTNMADEELRSIASLALCEAAIKFDPKRDIPFDGFAWTVVLRQLGKSMRREQQQSKGRVIARVRHEAYGDFTAFTDPGDVWNDDEASSRRHLDDMLDMAAARMALGMASTIMASQTEDIIAERTHYAACIAALQEALASLPEQPRRLLELRYFELAEFDAIAAALGSSNATVRRHHLDALALLGKRMRARGFASIS